MELANLHSGATRGARVLAMMHPSKADVTRSFVTVVMAGKARWEWDLHVLCWRDDAEAFQSIIQPSGSVLEHPDLLSEAAWETDPERVAEIDRRLAEAESKSGFTVGQLVAAAPASIGRAYVLPARKRQSSLLSNLVLQDNTQPFRIVRRIFAFADDMLDSVKPDLILATEWNTPVQCVVRLAAERRRIRCAVLRRSKIHSGYDFWTSDLFMNNLEAIERASAGGDTGGGLSDLAQGYIRRFREQPAVSGYVEAKWKSIGKQWQQSNLRRWVRLPLRLGRGLAVDAMYRVRGLDRSQRPPLFERIISPEVRKFQGWRQKRYLRSFDDAALRNMKYVYFPMHKETDMPLSFQSTPWQDQQNTVRMIASALPAGYRLLVREHRANYGQRPTMYYKYLSCIPNVVLVDAFDSQFKYLRHADLIVTETGSSGWEGLLLQKRVLTLADSFYDGAGLSVALRDPLKMSATMISLLSRPAVRDPDDHDRHLGRMIDAEMETAFFGDANAIEDCLDKLGRILGPRVSKGAAVTVE